MWRTNHQHILNHFKNFFHIDVVPRSSVSTKSRSSQRRTWQKLAGTSVKHVPRVPCRLGRNSIEILSYAHCHTFLHVANVMMYRDVSWCIYMIVIDSLYLWLSMLVFPSNWSTVHHPLWRLYPVCNAFNADRLDAQTSQPEILVGSVTVPWV